MQQAILLQSQENSVSFFLYFVLFLIFFLIAVYITRTIFSIGKIVGNLEKQTTILENIDKKIQFQNETIQNHNNIILAQLHLLSSVADKAGVPLEDINDVTKDFGIEFVP